MQKAPNLLTQSFLCIWGRLGELKIFAEFGFNPQNALCCC